MSSILTESEFLFVQHKKNTQEVFVYSDAMTHSLEGVKARGGMIERGDAYDTMSEEEGDLPDVPDCEFYGIIRFKKQAWRSIVVQSTKTSMEEIFENNKGKKPLSLVHFGFSQSTSTWFF